MVKNNNNTQSGEKIKATESADTKKTAAKKAPSKKSGTIKKTVKKAKDAIGVKVLGGIRQAPRLIAEHGVDAVVIACEMTREKEKIVLDLLAPSGVKISSFGFSEKPLMV